MPSQRAVCTSRVFQVYVMQSNRKAAIPLIDFDRKQLCILLSLLDVDMSHVCARVAYVGRFTYDLLTASYFARTMVYRSFPD